MLDVFRARTPDIPAVAAGAYALPFPDASFDAVTVAQAFHWFADEDALTEIARVLTPTGRLGLVWNHERLGLPRHAMADAYVTQVLAYTDDVPQYFKDTWKHTLRETNVFRGDPYEEWMEDYALPYSPAELWRRTQSKSYITSLPREEQDALKERLQETIDRFPDAPRDESGKYICPQFVRVVTMQKNSAARRN